MPNIDLDAARAARAAEREAKGEPITFVLDGDTFQLPPELPFEAVSALAPLRTATDEDNGPEVAGAILNLFRVLIGEERFPEFLAKRPSMDDLTVLMEGAFAEYGVTLGESSASNES